MTFDNEIGNHIVPTDTTEPMSVDKGASPKRLLLASLAGCTGIDVVMLLQKMKVEISGYEMEVEADLTNEHPKVYSEMRLKYIFYGKDIDQKKVQRAINLSQDKYCGVSAMIKMICPLKIEVEYREG
jgi:putative redox protein